MRLEQRLLRRASTRSCEIASSGRTKPSSLSFGQWSVCSAMLTGYFCGDDVRELGEGDRAGDHVLDASVPDEDSAPPVETCTMPSLSASANPRSAAFRVSDEVTLIAG